jgi:hypothetical protein
MFSRKPRTIRRTVTVQRSTRPYYEEQGWQVSGGRWFSTPKLTGYYRTPFGSYKGEIDPSYLKFSIINPPEELKSHSHWVCFSYRGGGRYSVHFRIRPRDIDSGIMQVERMLCESFEKNHRSAQ